MIITTVPLLTQYALEKLEASLRLVRELNQRRADPPNSRRSNSLAMGGTQPELGDSLRLSFNRLFDIFPGTFSVLLQITFGMKHCS